MSTNFDSPVFLLSCSNSWEKHEYLTYGDIVPFNQSDGLQKNRSEHIDTKVLSTMSTNLSPPVHLLSCSYSWEKHKYFTYGGIPPKNKVDGLTKEGSVKCMVCGQVFCNKQGLYRHNIIHSRNIQMCLM